MKNKNQKIQENKLDGKTSCDREYVMNMPQMCWGGLSENWFLKELGDIHWSMITDGLATQSDQLADRNGDRLYASFVRIRWESKTRLSSFLENDQINIKGTLSRYGSKMFFSEETVIGEDKEIKATLMSVFSSRTDGDNKKLTKGSPLFEESDRIMVRKKLPDFAKEYLRTKTALLNPEESLQEVPNELAGHVFPLNPAPVYRQDYTIDPYDDINGVGLLYFASYPKISDKCERLYFQQQLSADQEQADWAKHSSCLARDIFYFGNANPDEGLIYQLDSCNYINTTQIQLSSSLYRKIDGQLIAKIFTIKELTGSLITNQGLIEALSSSRKIYTPEKISEILIAFFVSILDISGLNKTTDLRPLGIESVIYLELTEHLIAVHHIESNPSKFYGLHTIAQIAEYLSLAYADNLLQKTGPVQPAVPQAPAPVADIAIIGSSFRVPGASTKAELWQLLSRGESALSKTPAGRWIWPDWVDLQGEHLGVDQGGYLEDIARFDASFFRVTPLEAELMDPQQRILLELTWELLEGAGYKATALKGSNTGVFIGASGSDYENLLRADNGEATLSATGTSVAILANRISHFYDFEGPSLLLDTACSSSLVAIHEAVKSIRSGECSQAVVGGVHLMCHPAKSLAYYKSSMLSVDGKCKTFDETANGYVRGEGAVVLLLKPLKDAIADGDPIQGVIKGTAINHGGQSGGLTVPSPVKQSRLIEDAYSSAGIPVSSVSYLEAHGTGTSLGDPIELAGLTAAFKKLNADAQAAPWCGIGSVKTNLGHLEAASGIAGVLKVLLAMQYRTLPPTINFKTLNSKIDLNQSPFYIQQDLSSWGESPEQVLRAGVSSFGIGGTNAHLILESFEQQGITVSPDSLSGSLLFVLSAKSAERLQVFAAQMRAYLEQNPQVNLNDLVYTLQTAREEMEQRLAIVFNDLRELKTGLENYNSGLSSAQLYTGNTRTAQPIVPPVTEKQIQQALATGESDKIGAYWCAGLVVDWSAGYGGKKHTWINLPAYPLAREHYWIPSAVVRADSTAILHPLLHRDESGEGEVKYASVFKGSEPFLEDHKVRGIKILPGVAQLELIREAAERNTGKKISQLRDIVFLRPVIVEGEPQKVSVALQTVNGETEFTVYAEQNGEKQAYSQGQLTQLKQPIADRVDLTAIQNRLKQSKTRNEYYTILREKGADYGPSYQGIAKLYYSEEEALSMISYPQEKGFVLNPGIMDSAIQTGFWLSFACRAGATLTLPFSVKEVNIYKPLPDVVWCYVRKSKNNKAGALITNFDIDLVNESGEVLLCLREFVYLTLKTASEEVAVSKSIAPVKDLYTQVWKRTLTVPDHPVTGGNHLLVTGLKAAPVTLAIRDFLKSKAVAVAEIAQLENLSAELTDIYLLQGLTDEADDLTEGFANRELAVFQSVRVLLASADQQKELNITVFTRNTQQVMPDDRVSENGSGIIGLMGSLAKEQPLWNIRVIDLDGSVPDDSAFAAILAYPADKEGAVIGYRKGFLYKNELYPLDLPVAKTTKFRKNGVYVLLGGAGGIGKVTAAHLVETYSAQVIWLGRRAADAEILEAQSALEKLGCRPAYICCDGNDSASMDRAYEQIKTTYGAIHGLFHSAIVLNDMLLRNMSEADFLKSFLPKSQASHHFVESFRNEPLDFVCFYSSVQSQWNAAGQGNYSAGCTYKDSYARAVSARYKLPVHIINWGYWGEVGIVASKAYQERLELLGIGSISAQEGMRVLETVLASEQLQVISVNFTDLETPAVKSLVTGYQQQEITIESILKVAKPALAVYKVNQDFESLEEEVYAKSLLTILVELGLKEKLAIEQDSTSLRKALQIEEKYERLFREFLKVLGEMNYLVSNNGLLEIPEAISQKIKDFKPGDALSELERKDPAFASRHLLLKSCLSSFSAILTGQTRATDIIFPDGSLSAVSGIYKGNYKADYFNEVLASVIRESVAQTLPYLKAGEKIRIIEIGAGTGGTSEAVFHKLQEFAAHIEYVYTDISKSFLFYAEESYLELAPYMETALFNIEESPVTQNIKKGQFDIVIGTNVVHATKDIARTVTNIKALLKKKGLLILNEIAKSELFTTLTFGLLDGWWLHEDQGIRLGGNPGLAAEKWELVLKETGYQEIGFLPEKANLPQQVLFAKSNGTVIVPVVGGSENQEKTLTAVKQEVAVHQPADIHQLADQKLAAHQLLKERLTVIAGRTIKMAADQIDTERQFSAYGFDSIIGLSLIKNINKDMGIALKPTDIFNYPNIDQLSEYIEEIFAVPVKDTTAAVDDKVVSPALQQKQADKEWVTDQLLTIAGKTIKLSKEKFETNVQFSAYGFDSIIGLSLIKNINKELGISLKPTDIFNYPNIEEMGDHMLETYAGELNHHTSLKEAPVLFKAAQTVIGVIGEQEKLNAEPENSKPLLRSAEVAIIGISGQFASANNLEEYWEALKNGTSLIKEFPADKWDLESHYSPDRTDLNKTYCKWGGFLENTEQFDPLFFKISGSEAKMMDPQQRLFLKHCWNAIEDAGILPGQLNKSKCAVYVGADSGEYLDTTENKDASAFWGNSGAILAARISYFLNLKGPAISIDTACSSSLVAMDMGYRSLINYDADMIITGGVMLNSFGFYRHTSRAGMLSPDGRCFPFDSRANGFVPGEGAGVLIMKRLEDAERDGDHIYGVIKGSLTNQDGTTNGITAPSVLSQISLEKEVYEKYQINPETISYVEAHGTGTNLGDPIEFEALTTSFRAFTTQKQFCALGSVKSNIGHTSRAAGAAGVIKVLLALKHKQLPPTINYEICNPYIDLSNSPFYIPAELTKWEPANGQPRIATVSSFGFSGTNAHIVIGEYQGKTCPVYSQELPAIIVLSARNTDRLKERALLLKQFLAVNSDVNLFDLAYTLQLGREAMDERLAFEAPDLEELTFRLDSFITGNEENLLRGNIKKTKRDAVQENNTAISLAELWISGSVVNWNILYPANKPSKISLPGYPFARESYSYERVAVNTLISAPVIKQAVTTGSIWDSEEISRCKNHITGKEIQVEMLAGGIALVRMESRESKNMFTSTFLLSLQKTFLDLHSRQDLKVVVLTGYDNIFAMGGSEEVLQNIASMKNRFTEEPFLYRGLLEFDVPVISAVQGHAFGGGLVLGLYADIVLLSEESTYTANFMKYGFTPGMGATYIIGEKLGKQLAVEMMYTAKLISGEEIKKRGASVIVSKDVLKEALQIARELSAKPRIALKVLKEKISRHILAELTVHVKEETEMHALTFHTEEVKSLISHHFKPTTLTATTGKQNQPVQYNAPRVSLSDPMEGTAVLSAPQAFAPMETGHQTSSITAQLKTIFAKVLHIPESELEEEATFVDFGLDSINGVEIIRAVNDTFNLSLEAVQLYDYPTLALLSGLLIQEPGLSGQPAPAVLTRLSALTEEAHLPENSGANVPEIISRLKDIFGKVLHIAENELDEQATFVDFGLDSINGVELIRSVNDSFGLTLEAVMLYDYHTLSLLAELIAKEADWSAVQVKPDFLAELILKPVVPVLPLETALPVQREILLQPAQPVQRTTDIAVIGMSGRFPGAANIAEFWDNLKKGENSIQRVPERKLSTDQYPDDRLADKINNKWMGILDGEDLFDPAFFNISPREAERMDPQQRIFLEESWKAIEDSGYAGSSLSGSKCGVFVGVAQGDYTSHFNSAELDSHLLSGSSTSILAARISYYLNLRGPAISIDTACSSSLVAIHQACQSIRSGECTTALAGGVYIMTTAQMLTMTDNAGMLSKDGQCYTFDHRADGYVPGEAAGVLLLKSLDQAARDGDHIYGVIRGSGINQDGKTNGITAPSAASQVRLEKDVYAQWEVDPSTISYVEAHGTGTQLGDPIEIKALKDAFKSDQMQVNSCGLGSVKTNIGHTLTAAGVCGVIKVLLSLKYGQLPPTLNFEKLNSHIKLEDSPFYIVDVLQEWKKNPAYPRRAAVSSFGLSGTNAHLVIEEYTTRKNEPFIGTSPAIILLSAKNKTGLKEQVINLGSYLFNHPQTELHAIAYTLQVGREEMEERLAVIAGSKDELIHKLGLYTAGKTAQDRLYTGNIKNQQTGNVPGHGELESLAQLWIKGVRANWDLLYPGNKPQRISLPVYPFARESYWAPADAGVKVWKQQRLHPLVHQNKSDLKHQKYSSIYTGRESFFEDHQVNGQKIFPGTAYLELARAAGQNAAHQKVTTLKDIAWLRPVKGGNGPQQIEISLAAAGEDINYEIYSQQADEFILHSKGRMGTQEQLAPERFDLTAIQRRLVNRKDQQGCYQIFKEKGLNYGLSFNGIKQVYYNKEEAIAEISLPKQPGFLWAPGLLDSVLQTCMALGFEHDSAVLALPTHIGELISYQDLPADVWSYVRKNKVDALNGENSYAVDIVDEMGECLMSFRDFILLPVNNSIPENKAAAVKERACHLYESTWKESPVESQTQIEHQVIHLVFVAGGTVVLAEQLQDKLDVVVESLPGETAESYFISVFERVKTAMEQQVETQVTLVCTHEDYLNYGFISGLLKSAQQENPKISGKVLSIDSLSLSELSNISALIEAELGNSESEVRYQNGIRKVRTLQELAVNAGVLAGDLHELPAVKFKEGGVYLITGGAGGLGSIFAKHISKIKNTRLILTGRSELNETVKELISGLPHAVYYSCDIGHADEVNSLLKMIRENYAGLNGIIHSAGVLRDSFILKKTRKEILEVLSPKINGVRNLDEATRADQLDFMVYFSSISGVLGNVGQTDYASANAYLDNYAVYRNALQASGKRNGKTLSINWPLWKDGGMQIDAESERYLEKEWGMYPLPAEEGIIAFEQLLCSKTNQGIAAYGKELIAAMAEHQQKKTAAGKVNTAHKLHSNQVINEDLVESSRLYFRKVLSGELKLQEHKFENDAPFEKYGIDSILIVKLTGRLEEDFGKLPKTLFFEYQNLEELLVYFLEEHQERLKELTNSKAKAAVIFEKKSPDYIPLLRKNDNQVPEIRQVAEVKKEREINSGAEEIAIIGLSGRYPGAYTLQEFWENLKTGKDCITEIPGERWNVADFYDPKKGVEGKSYSKWGGFIADADKFDPLFFNISPREAELMDPQERLFLQVAWQTVEDAGYTKSLFRANPQEDLKGKVGVFVGVMYQEYMLYGVDGRSAEHRLTPGGSISSIANRVSYLLNLHGPSMAVDTMCSSSLTAIHLACESISSGDCELAIAGGVNLSIHPNKYLKLSEGGFASSKGYCESFGEGAEGYVPAEGVGAVLLKNLKQAIADGDQIYAVIKGSAINHGGKTNGYAVPNPKAQTAVIKEAIKRAGISSDELSYIEAHGTGTVLGDPIEIAGLIKAFGSEKKQYCSIGSVKSNIGHAESAAGISGLTKLLLQLKHQQLVPSLHSSILNPNIDFANSPFRVQQELAPWETENNKPRLAGISGFGAGGSNAHLIIAEYKTEMPAEQRDTPLIIVLSAKNKNRLKELAVNLKGYLLGQALTDLHAVAYTLQTGREEMEERLAIVPDDREDLLLQLTLYAEDKPEQKTFFTGNIKGRTTEDFVLDGGAGEAYITYAIQNRENKSLAQLWVKGIRISWDLLYQGNKPSRISLPVYSFARERYWVAEPETGDAGQQQLHPLLHQNESDLSVQKYSSVYTGKEKFLRDHLVNKVKILPGVAYLELARAAGERAAGKKITTIKEVTWLKPFRVENQSRKIEISLVPAGDQIGYEVYSFEQQELVIHSKGKLETKALQQPEPYNLAVILERLPDSKDHSECYEIFKEKGFDYGAGFKGITQLYYSSEEAVSKINLPEQDGFVLSPGLLDCALQTCMGLKFGQENQEQALPFSIKEVTIYQALPETVWAYVRKNPTQKDTSRIINYMIDLLDENGEVLLSFRDFTLLPVNGGVKNETGLYVPVWKERAIEGLPVRDHVAQLVLLAGGTAILADQLQESLDMVVESLDEKTAAAYFIHVFEKIKTRLAQQSNANITVVCTQKEYQAYGFISGLLKSAQQENPKITGKVLIVDGFSLQDIPELKRLILAEQRTRATEVRYHQGIRAVKMLEPLALAPVASIPGVQFKEGGIYLITGGIGGLGLIFAAKINAVKNTRLILTGRSELNEAGRLALSHLPEAIYECCDVGVADEVNSLLDRIRKQYGKLDGIIHSAGVIRDSFIVKKTRAEIEQVLNPKIIGVKNLDEASCSDQLDFMVYFSSVSGVLGNAGQADYASANAYLDNYAVYRNGLQADGKRSGKTLSINWPLWKDGGMQIDAESEKYIARQWGMSPLPVREGLMAFEQLMHSAHGQGIVVFGQTTKIASVLLSKFEETPQKTGQQENKVKQQEITRILIEICSGLLKLNAADFEVDVNFLEYGVDSIMMMKMINTFEARFDITMEPTAIVNYPTIALLAEHLFNEKYLVADTLVAPVVTQGKRFSEPEKNKGKVAVIGMSCKLPQSDNLEEFWRNLKAGTDLIGETPSNRWAAADYYSKEPALDKTYTSKGGFIRNAGLFDAKYYKINQVSAIAMDPQQRIVLELSRDLFAHAGYTREEVAGSRTSIYIGAKDNNYVRNNYHLLPEGAHQHTVVNNISNIIAARVSDFYDLKGTSQVIDTACSSSMVAIHQACEDILSGKATMAIAGGIHVMVDAFMHIAFSQAQVLSKDGKSYVFDERADGFVMSEGAGLVLLKDYEQALADGDQIFGVIDGSAVNNDGHTMGMTVPNLDGQKEVIAAALQKSGVSPADITYYEAHGTGTLLGDPIEIKAATEVYRNSTAKKQYCALGAVKSNLGHNMTAAGVTGMIKILLQMQYNQLVPTLNCEKPHPRFRFEDSPFYPNTILKNWESEEKIAAISSFGFGGTNCHLVVSKPAHQDTFPQRVAIPVYRESARHYWLGDHLTVNKPAEKIPAEAKVLKTVYYSYNEPYLRDHLVNNQRVLLGVTYAALLLDGLKKEAEGREISSLLFQNKVQLNAGDEVKIAVEITKGTALATSHLLKEQHTQEVASAKVIKNTLALPKEFSSPITNVQRDYDQLIEKSSFYKREEGGAIVHGETLQVIERVLIKGRESVGELSIPFPLDDLHEYLEVHPALLNGGLLAALSAIEIDTPFIPLMIKRLKVYHKVNDSCLSYGKVIKANREMLEVDFYLCSAAGQVLVEVNGFVCKRIELQEQEKEAVASSIEDTEPVEEVAGIQDMLSSVENFIRQQLLQVFTGNVWSVPADQNFMDIGLDSTQLISLVKVIEQELDEELYPTLFFEYQNIRELSKYLLETYPEKLWMTDLKY